MTSCIKRYADGSYTSANADLVYYTKCRDSTQGDQIIY